MSIPTRIKIKGHSSPTTPNPSSGRRGNLLPAQPGVYLFKDKKRKVVYVGKATNLRSRVNSYWKTATLHRGSSLKTAATRIGGAGRAIDEMLHEVARIDWITTDSVIEALILEANLIRKYMPRYNVKEKDDKSFLYVVITREQWPRVELVRGNDVNVDVNVVGVASESSRRRSLSAATPYRLVFGPYTSASSIRAALDLIRKWFPWSTCAPKIANSQFSKFGISKFNARPCFDYHIGRCPGVCIGAVTRREYMKNIRNVILMLEGKKARVIKNVKLKMQNEAKKENFEEAENLRRKLFALQHIRDIAVLTKGANYESVANSRISNSEIRKFESHSQFAPRCVGAINVFGRVEGYDISNISGTNAVGSMVVFQDGEARKSEYRKFRIKTIKGINDVAMMKEMLERRFAH
ncbi:MAG: GIY-YIG nuclease family protein, partial [bacterium]|nr:GIY-YIG nuclease family protein [bacterium]